MNNLNLAAMALWAGLSMSCSPKTSTVKGIICDATMNTLTIVTEANDTLSFGTANAEKTATDGILLNDTATVSYEGKYNVSMNAQKVIVVPSPRD